MSDDFERYFFEEVKEQEAGGPDRAAKRADVPIPARKAVSPPQRREGGGCLVFLLGLFGAMVGNLIGLLLTGNLGSWTTCLLAGIGFAIGSVVGRDLRNAR